MCLIVLFFLSLCYMCIYICLIAIACICFLQIKNSFIHSFIHTYSTCMSLHIIHVCLSNSISADQKWCTTSTKWNKEIYHRKSTENLPSLNTLIINITTPCTSIVNKSYTEMKEFTDEKRGNPQYRNERVHQWKKEETPYTEMKEFTDEKKRKPPIQRWKSSPPILCLNTRKPPILCLNMRKPPILCLNNFCL